MFLSALRKNNSLLFLLSVLIFRVLLEISYVQVISVRFVYDGFLYNFDWSSYVLSWLLFIISIFTLSSNLRKVSDYFFITAFLAIIAPLTVLYGYDYEKDIYPVIVTLSAILIIKFLLKINLISFKSLKTVRQGLPLSVTISFLFVIFLLVWFFIKGVNFNFNLLDVYEYRDENKSLLGFGVFAYTNNWTYQVFNIFLFATALLYRKYFLAVIFFLAQIVFFAGSAHKTILFLPLLVLGIWFYFRNYKSLIIVPLIFSLVICITLFSYFLYDDIIASSMFSRRVFFTPAQLTFAYFDFFSAQPLLFWSNSVLSGIIEYPYDVKFTHLIGSHLGKDGVGANNGFISSGYAHAGLVGVFLYVVLVAFLLKFIDDITSGIMRLWFAISLVIVPIRSFLISSDLFTVMLTHGLVVSIILLYLARKRPVI